MKKIVMLTCLKANTVCTGAGCLKAFNEKTKTFSRYGSEELELEAFFRCNGCGVWDEGMEEKLERLISIKPDAVHLGVCTKLKDGTRCPTIERIAKRLEKTPQSQSEVTACSNTAAASLFCCPNLARREDFAKHDAQDSANKTKIESPVVIS